MAALANFLEVNYLEIVIFFLLFFIFFFFSISLLKPNNGLPRNLPFFGMSLMLFLDRHMLLDKVTEILVRSKGTFFLKGFWFSNMDMLVTSDPKNLDYVTKTNFWNYPKGSEAKELFEVLGDGLFNLDFDEWSLFRRISCSFIKHRKFHQFMNKVLVDNVNNALIPFLELVTKQDLIVDFQRVFQRHTYDVAWTMSTGFNPNTISKHLQEDVPFLNAMNDACEAMFFRHISPGSFWRLKRWLQLGQEKKLSAAKKTIQEIMENYIAMRREEIKESALRNDDVEEESFDALGLFLTGHEIVETTLPEQVLRDNMINLTFAAYDTTSATLSWLFWLLARNPQVEAKIKQELDNNFPRVEGKKWQMRSKEELSKLVYLHASLCETLRLYPPAPFEYRTSVKNDILPSGHHVKPNLKVILSTYAIARMTSIWGEDCLEFRPERWIDEKGGLKYEAPSKFFAFLAGPRVCVGKELAFSMMKAAAATIVHSYHVQLVETQPLTIKPSIILVMKDGLRVRIKRRT